MTVEEATLTWIGGGGVNRGIYDNNLGRWAIYSDNNGICHTGFSMYFHKEGSTKTYDMALMNDTNGNTYLTPPLSTWSGGTGATSIQDAKMNLGIISGSSVPSSGSYQNIFIQV